MHIEVKVRDFIWRVNKYVNRTWKCQQQKYKLYSGIRFKKNDFMQF